MRKRTLRAVAEPPEQAPAAPSGAPRPEGWGLGGEGHFPLLFALTLLLALGARLWGLAREGFFIDEVRQASAYGAGLAEVTRVAVAQKVPPLDYWIGHFVSFFSPGDFALRLPAALFGVGSTGLLMLLVRRAASPAAALLAGALFALLPYPVHIAQEIRPYSSATFFFLALLLLCFRILEEGGRVKAGTSLLLFACTLCFLLTRTDGPLLLTFLVSAAMVISIRRREGDWRSILLFLAAVGMALAAYSPFLAMLVRSGTRYLNTAGGGISALKGFSLGPLGRAYIVQLDLAGLLLLPLMIAGVVLALGGKKTPSPFPRMAGALLLAAPVLHLAIYQAYSTTTLQPAYLFYLAPLVLLVSSIGFARMGELIPAGAGKLLPVAGRGAAILLLGSAGASFLSLQGQAINEDWRGVCSYVESLGGEKAILFDGVTPFRSQEHAFYGFPRYYRPLRTPLSLEEVNALLEETPLDLGKVHLFKDRDFLRFYARKSFFDFGFPCPNVFESTPSGTKTLPAEFLKWPDALATMGWELSLPEQEREGMAHVVFLPFHKTEGLARRQPVLILAIPTSGRLTSWSPFPFREDASLESGTLDSLASDAGMIVASFPGFLVVRPARPSGDLLPDLLSLIDRVLPGYPNDSSRVDPLLAAVWLEKTMGAGSWDKRYDQIDRACRREEIDLQREVLPLARLYRE